jgi:hypothetical protein
MACIEHCAEIGRHVGRQRLSISFAKALADAMTLGMGNYIGRLGMYCGNMLPEMRNNRRRYTQVPRQ